MQSLEDLQSYAIDGHVSFESIGDNYPVVLLENDYGKAKVALHGAHVLDYIPAGEEAVIFTSKEAVFEKGTPVRGGIPVCWPWFNAHPTNPDLPSHGYARRDFWQLFQTNKGGDPLGTGSKDPELLSAVFTFSHEDLHAELTIVLAESLHVQLKTTNTGDEAARVGGALHTYFRVSDISNVSLRGLNRTEYIDTVNDSEAQQAGEVVVSKLTDRIYYDTKSSITIQDGGFKRDIVVEKSGSETTVVWNPWIEKSAEMKDLGNDEYLEFICVEAANALSDVHKVSPGGSHTLATKITARPVTKCG